MNVKGIIMDFGDTLVSYPLHTVTGQLAFIEEFSQDFFNRYPDVPKPQKPLREFAAELNIEESDGRTVALVERLQSERLLGSSATLAQAELFEVEILNAVFRGGRVLSDAEEFVNTASGAGYKLGIMSNLPWGSSSYHWQQEFSRHGFGDSIIDTAICCVDVGFRKPRPEGIQRIAQSWSLEPNEIAFIGDNRHADMLAAARAGCHGIFVDRLNQGAEDAARYSTIKNLDHALGIIAEL